MGNTAYLLIGIEPTDEWPLVPKGKKFNGDVTAWTAFSSREAAESKMAELQSNPEYETEWQIVPRRLEGGD